MSPGLTIFEGDNGAGKSSVLEAISLIASGRSFRTNKMSLVTQKGEDQFVIHGELSPLLKVGLNHIKSSKSNRVKVDGRIATSLSELTKLYPTQVICPESYHLIDSGPGERRKFLDWILFHVEHSYHDVWRKFNRVLKQRNALLRQHGSRARIADFKFWDSQLNEHAETINQSRKNIMALLETYLSQVLDSMRVDFFKDLVSHYYSGYGEDLETKLSESFLSDRERGYTQYGPHKADLRIKIGSHMARDILSRGQKKVLINALYLAQTMLLKQRTDKDSLFIIDDFTSELDLANQQALLTALMAQKNTQIVISCLQLDALKWLKKGYNRAHMFHVEHGEITAINPGESNE